MSDALGAEQNGVVKVKIGWAAILYGFSGVEDEWDMDTKFLLPLNKLQQWLQVVDEWMQGVLVPNQIEPRNKVRERLLHGEAIL